MKRQRILSLFSNNKNKEYRKRRNKRRYSAIKISYSISRVGSDQLWGAAIRIHMLQQPTKSLSRYLVSHPGPAKVPNGSLIGPSMALGTMKPVSRTNQAYL
jgi:hypothetical protein